MYVNIVLSEICYNQTLMHIWYTMNIFQHTTNVYNKYPSAPNVN